MMQRQRSKDDFSLKKSNSKVGTNNEEDSEDDGFIGH